MEQHRLSSLADRIFDDPLTDRRLSALGPEGMDLSDAEVDAVLAAAIVHLGLVPGAVGRGLRVSPLDLTQEIVGDAERWSFRSSRATETWVEVRGEVASVFHLQAPTPGALERTHVDFLEVISNVVAPPARDRVAAGASTYVVSSRWRCQRPGRPAQF